MLAEKGVARAAVQLGKTFDHVASSSRRSSVVNRRIRPGT
jgi:hypothetical protein